MVGAVTATPAGNRELHFDEYVIWVLLYLFNPLITSILGMLQEAGDIDKAAEAVGSESVFSRFIQ